MTKMAAVATGIITALMFVIPANRAFAASNAVPGTVNYVEGTVLFDGSPITPKQIGSINLGPQDTLQTQQGKAEVLLTPGVFVRMGNNSEIRVIRPELADTRVDVNHGQAMVEVAEIYKENHIEVGEDNATTVLQKIGLYRFDANANTVSVITGEAQVTQNDLHKELKKDHYFQLASAELKPAKFDGNAEDDLYRWSALRSEYMADASLQSARGVYANSTPWIGSGWFWNPWFSSYAWLPGDGYFYDPFGFPFFSPGYVGYAPYLGYYGGHGFVGNRGRVGAFRGVAAVRSAPAAHFGGGAATISSHGGFGGGGRR